MLWKALLVFTALALPITEGAVLCYFESWAVYRFGDGRVNVEDLEPALCTHYIYAFAGLNTDFTIRVLDPWADLCDGGGKCGYNKFTNMKDHNPFLKTLLSVGGWNEGSALYSQMASNSEDRATFIHSTINLLRRHRFDGLDLSWSYPTQNGGRPEDKENYVTLLRELKASLSDNDMVLTVSVSPSKGIIDEAYDIAGMAEHVDLVSVMTYNYHGPWDHYTHHHSALFAFTEDTGDDRLMNVDYSLKYWMEGGMPANKLVMGVPMFGRCWTLDTDEQDGYYTPAYLPGDAGPYTQEPGMLSFTEICKAQQRDGWTVAVEVGCNEPYTYHIPSNRIWCSYENHASVAIKAKYAIDNGLGGVMVWSINNDDAHAACGDRKYDLTWTLAETYSSGAQ